MPDLNTMTGILGCGVGIKGETFAGTLSPTLGRYYLAQTTDVHYDIRPGQEGDEEKR